MHALEAASVEAAFLFSGARTVVVMRAHVRAITPRRARWHRRKRHAHAGFQIRHANDDAGLDANAFAFGARGETVVVAVATEIGEKDAGFLVLVVEKCVSALEIAVFVALDGSWLMATVAERKQGKDL